MSAPENGRPAFSENCQGLLCSDEINQEGGRRIYIQERALKFLAATFSENADLVFDMVAKMMLAKIVHHVIEEDSVMLGESSAERAQVLSSAANEVWGNDISKTLRKVGIKARGEKEPTHLLESGERIYATCYFSGYFTLATGEKAAQGMFRDTNKISSVRKIKHDGVGYEDLTLVSGNHLVIMGSEISDVSARKNKPLSGREFSAAHVHAYSKAKEEFKSIVEKYMPHRSLGEQAAIERVGRLFEQAFYKGIFRSAAS